MSRKKNSNHVEHRVLIPSPVCASGRRFESVSASEHEAAAQERRKNLREDEAISRVANLNIIARCE
jgi:hypothetical protein